MLYEFLVSLSTYYCKIYFSRVFYSCRAMSIRLYECDTIAMTLRQNCDRITRTLRLCTF